MLNGISINQCWLNVYIYVGYKSVKKYRTDNAL